MSMSRIESMDMQTPRLLRPVGHPLGLYLRPGRNDHRALLQLLAESTALAGIVFDPCMEGRQEELRTDAVRAGVDAILDPRTVELATPTGFERVAPTNLPWAASAPDTPDAWRGTAGAERVEVLAAYVREKGFSSVLAPTHYLRAATDPWLEVDAALVRRLRNLLDAQGGAHVAIYYPLVLHATAFRDTIQRRTLIASLQGTPIDALWLRIHPFGSASGPNALRGYIEACRELHRVGVPLIGERTGTIGVALAAFGAVGAVESGVTFGERFDVAPLVKPRPKGDAFLPPPRVYLPQLGAFLSRKQADEFFENRQMKIAFGCRDTSCCRRGTTDTLADPKHHFMTQRLRELGRLSRAPETLRAQIYLDDFLRPATDLALKAARVEPALEPVRQRLESWRLTLGAISRSTESFSFAAVPQGGRLDHRLSA
jgi:hypothetical protein